MSMLLGCHQAALGHFVLFIPAIAGTTAHAADSQPAFCRSFVELRMTSVVWNYKYADVEFGRLQARDLLQHLWTGPISNAPVDIVQVCESQARRH